MKYRVEVSPEVRDQVDAQVAYYESERVSELTIVEWLSGLYDRFVNLQEHPKRFPVAVARTAARGYEIRRLNHGEFVVFYRVLDDQRLVQILDFRHGRRRPIDDEDQS